MRYVIKHLTDRTYQDLQDKGYLDRDPMAQQLQYPECRGDCKVCDDYPCNDELLKAEEALLEHAGTDDW